MQEIKEQTSYRGLLRVKILETAMGAFAEKGIKAVRMDDIATSLSISKRTLYELYGDKESLLYEAISKVQHRRRQEVQHIAEESASVMDIILRFYQMHLEEVRRINPVFYADLERYPRVMEALSSEREGKMQQFMAFMTRGVEEGYFRAGINYEIVAHLFDALGKYMMENHLYEAYSFKELYDNMLFVSLRGFCTEKGVKELDKAISVK